MTIRQVLVRTKERLSNRSSSPWLEAVDLLGAALKQPREHILTLEPEAKIPDEAAAKLKKLVDARSSGYPLPYLLGHQPFSGLDFYVAQSVLIPRPETETLVNEARNAVFDSMNRLALGNKRLAVIDVGTGSGCVAISLIKSLHSANQNVSFFATDISSKALAVAKKNAKLHGLEDSIEFLQGDLLDSFFRVWEYQNGDELLILANLPYLTSDQIEENQALQSEPRIALYGGEDGLDLYQRLFEQLNESPWQNVRMLLEIDSGQRQNMEMLANHFFQGMPVRIINDIHYLPRVVGIG